MNFMLLCEAQQPSVMPPPPPYLKMFEIILLHLSVPPHIDKQKNVLRIVVEMLYIG